MAFVQIKQTIAQEHHVHLTDEQLTLYKENPDAFWELFYEDLQHSRTFMDEKIVDEWVDVYE